MKENIKNKVSGNDSKTEFSVGHYIQPQTPSELANNGKSKENRNHLKQVGLTTAVDMDSGIPMFHKIYKGNAHDSNCFSEIIDELILNTDLHGF